MQIKETVCTNALYYFQEKKKKEKRKSHICCLHIKLAKHPR